MAIGEVAIRVVLATTPRGRGQIIHTRSKTPKNRRRRGVDEERRAVEGDKVLAMERALRRRVSEIALLRSNGLGE